MKSIRSLSTSAALRSLRIELGEIDRKIGDAERRRNDVEQAIHDIETSIDIDSPVDRDTMRRAEQAVISVCINELNRKHGVKS